MLLLLFQHCLFLKMKEKIAIQLYGYLELKIFHVFKIYN